RRLPGQQTGRGLLRQVRQQHDDADRHRQRGGQHSGRVRAAQTGRVRRPTTPAEGQPTGRVRAVREPRRGETAPMARMNASTNRFDPYRNFRFKVKWDNQYVAGLTKMGALKRTTEMVEYREAGENITSRKLPGKTKYEPVTLEAGVTYDTAFSDWANLVNDFASHSVTSLGEFRKNITVDVFNEAGQKAISYNLYRCWVSEYQALPDLDAGANAVAITTIKLEFE